MTKRPLFIAAIFLAALLAVSPGRAQTPTEYQVKAAFLYHFAQFVEWPASGGDSDSFGVCLIGRDPFGPILEQTMANKKVRDRSVRVERFSGLEKIKGCRILFVGSSERGRFRPILEKAAQSGVLAIGESDGFLEAGGMINFVLVESKVRFLINQSAAESAGLKVSSKLLRLGMQ
jgi:hypothetical protein